MSKKMMKRSLALGALMAFVITGSAMAEEKVFKDVSGDIIGENISVVSQDSDAVTFVRRDVRDNGDLVLNIGNADTKTITLKTEGTTNVGGLYVDYFKTNGTGDKQTVNITASQSIGIYNLKANDAAALWVQGQGYGKTTVNVDAPNITIEGNDDAIMATGGAIVNIDGSKSGVIILKGADAICTRGGSTININASGKHIVNIIGDINFEKQYADMAAANNVDSNVNINLNGRDSYFEGKVYVSDRSGNNPPQDSSNVTGLTIGLSNGATWNVTGDSFVNELNGSGGKIVFEDDSHVHIDAGSGDLDITKKDLTAESINGLSKEDVVAKFDSVAKQLGVKDAGNAPKATVVVAEGDVKGEVTGVVTFVDPAKDEDNDEGAEAIAISAPVEGDVECSADNYWHGEVTEVTEKVNTKNQAIGEAGISLKLHWRAHVNDMNKRMGELRNAEGEHGVWARMVRGESEYKNTKAQYNQYQLGYDEKLSVDERWTVGAAVTFAEGDANYGQGSTDDKSTAFAIYGSKLNNDGTFVDLIARYAHLESDLDDVNSGKGDYATNGMSVSAEFGKRIQQGNGLWVEPQVELTYGTIDSAEFMFDSGKAVQVGDMDSLIGRVGFRIGKDLEQGNVYARASYLYDFEGETENAFSKDDVSRTIAEDLGGGWWEVGVGANINLSKATYIYADVEKTFGGEVDTNWQWNLGVRYSF